MNRATAVQMVEDLTAAGASVALSIFIQGGNTEWSVQANKAGGITAIQVANVAAKYGVTGLIDGARFV